MNRKILALFIPLYFLSICVHAQEGAKTEISLANNAYEFMVQGWGGEAIQGYESAPDVKRFFRQVGKIKKETILLVKNRYDKSANDEVRTFRYDGMSIEVYSSHWEGEEKSMVLDVVVTDRKWPIKYGLVVGSARNHVEALLGKSMNADIRREWRYADGMDEVIFTFDKNDRVTSIHWHSSID